MASSAKPNTGNPNGSSRAKKKKKKKALNTNVSQQQKKKQPEPQVPAASKVNVQNAVSSAQQSKKAVGVSEKIAYLQMVNDRVEKSRLTSFGLKGVAFLFLCYIMTHLNLYMLIAAICLSLLFFAADATLKRHELIYQKLYNDIRFGNKKVDFDLQPVYQQDQVFTWFYSLRRSSVWIYHTVILVVEVVILILMLVTTA